MITILPKKITSFFVLSFCCLLLGCNNVAPEKMTDGSFDAFGKRQIKMHPNIKKTRRPLPDWFRPFFSPHQHDSCNYTEFYFDDFEIQILPASELPYESNDSTMVERQAYDDDSVPIIKFHRIYRYHPVYIAEYTLDLIDVYTTTKDTACIPVIMRNLNKLVTLGVQADSSLFYPYDFDFRMHYDYQDMMLAPWYSGMAQGLVLSLFCRVYEFTGREEYLTYSKKIFNSYLRLKGDGFQPWVSCVDANGNLWLEEYPKDVPCFTLNGMIFAIYGIYDYYRLTHDETAERYLKGSITTIKKNVERFRNENDITYYCIKHEIKAPEYQDLHINQLLMLEKMTNDSYFGDVAKAMRTDIDNYNIEKSKAIR